MPFDLPISILLIEAAKPLRDCYLQWLNNDWRYQFEVNTCLTLEAGLMYCEQQRPQLMVIGFSEAVDRDTLLTAQQPLQALGIPCLWIGPDDFNPRQLGLIDSREWSYLSQRVLQPELFSLTIHSLLTLAQVGSPWPAPTVDRALSRQTCYDQLAQISPVGVFWLSGTGTYEEFNDRYCQITGYSRAELLQADWIATVDEQDRGQIITLWQYALQTQSEFIAEYRFQHPSGQIRWVYGQIVPVLDQPTAQTSYLGTITDITDRKQAEAGLAISETGPLSGSEIANRMLLTHTVNGQITYASPQFYQLVGVEPGALQDQALGAFIHPEDWQNYGQLQRSELLTLAYQPIGLELRCRQARGNWCQLSAQVSPIRSHAGKVLGFQIVIYQVSRSQPSRTEQNQFEVALRNLVEGTVSSTGDRFLRILVHQITQVLGVRQAAIGTLEGDWVSTLVVWSDHQVSPNLRYPVAGTPCEQVFRHGVYHCAENLQQLFPRDKNLIALEAESYLGVAMQDGEGTTFGHLFILDNLPMHDREHFERILKILAARAASELERQRATSALHELNAKLEQRVQQRTHELTLTNEKLIAEIQQHQRTEAQLNLQIERLNWLYHLVLDLNQAETLEEIYTIGLNGICQTLQVFSAAILIPDDRGIPRYQASVGLSQNYQTAVESHFETSQTGLNDQVVILSDFSDTAGIPFLTHLRAVESIQAAASFPLCYQSQNLGKVIVYYDTPHIFSEEEIKIAKTVTTYIATAMTRKQGENALQESKEQLKAVLNAVPETISWVGANQTYLGVNRKVAEQFQLQPEDFTGRPVGFMQEESQFIQFVKEFFASNQQSASQEITYVVDSESFTYLTIAQKYNREQNAVFIQIDISERKRAEDKLQIINDCLADANLELARVTRLKDEFLANMSHELRTPLNAILGLSEGLLDQVYGDLNAKQLKSIGTIERSGRHLLELINDILDLAKIESGKLELHMAMVDIHHLCESSLSFIRQLATKKSLQIHLQVPAEGIYIQVDDLRMRQSLINLLSNAVKFTPEQGQISLIVELDEINQKINFHVIDTGIGIAQEDLNKLFQSFVQIDSSLNRQYEGTGLGLALVKRIVQLHNGTIAVKSEVGKGSQFTITLPWQLKNKPWLKPQPTVTIEPLPTYEPDEPVQPSQPAPLILLAEDNEANREMLSDYLIEQGYRLKMAKDGAEAIQMSQTLKPQLIIMDIQMPGTDGLMAIQSIRSHPATQAIPIIALTALVMQGDRERCLATGANQYMTKPVSLKQLTLTIHELLQLPPLTCSISP
ncbi:PAS domain S-box protein [Alkalinema sp. FACHB-956]|uniref:PAS domain S-box protein n=1 Tax=Alkalinema sp. FACHB-956 TaxID=2692768 RepID=UPI001687A8C1|nr:PAS domain S-box protein [Alkalinema sp. FACHB-956]MBD2326388.1 PAS domain S-box protein [Alkalinema sp. FACHB-956]